MVYEISLLEELVWNISRLAVGHLAMTFSYLVKTSFSGDVNYLAVKGRTQ